MEAEHNMARRIQLRRDTAANWSSTNPTLAQGEIGIDLTNNKIKIGTGTTAWNSLSYWDDQETASIGAFEFAGNVITTSDSSSIIIDQAVVINSELTMHGDIVPNIANEHTLGTPQQPWKSLYVSGSTIYLGDNALSVDTNGEILINDNRLVQDNGNYIKLNLNVNDVQVSDLQVGDTLQWAGGFWVNGPNGGSITVGNGNSTSVENVTEILINGTITEIEPGVVGITVSGSEGLPTITVPATQGTTYKGLQVAYGGFHTNTGQSSTRNVTKVVIHKPAVTTVDITDDSNSDFFEVAGVGSSDILAMFVVIGDINGEKPLSDIQAFAEAVIDNVILDNAVEGQYQSVNDMKAAFYDNYPSLALAANGLATDFEFFNNVFAINGGVTTVQEGSGAIFEIQDLGDGTYNGSSVISGGINYLPGHKIKISGEDLGATSGAASSMIVTNGPNLNWTNSGILAGNFGLQFNITVDENGNATVSNISNGGTGKSVGDTFTLPGTVFTGLSSPEDDISFEITAIDVSANDCIIEVNSTSEGTILTVTPTGTSVGLAVYTLVSGTNYNVGSGFDVIRVYKYETSLDSNSNGSNYVENDVITLLGSNITNGTSPENDITITVRSLYGSGSVNGFDVSGTIPNLWRTNNISDGGEDEYDTGNYIDSSYLNEIAYNGGNTVVDGVAAFGTGSSYSFVYEDSVFGLFVTGNNSTSIGTSGGGPDSGSTIISGYIYGPNTAEQTFDNAVSFINLVGTQYAGPVVSFTHSDDGDEVDVLIADDGEGAGVGITRSNDGGGIYNPYREGEWDSDVSPSGTLWNTDGWADFSDVESRNYTNLYAAFGSGGLGNKIVGAECVMYLPDNGKYYAVKFTQWTQNNNGGGFAYTRQELDLDSLETGIGFQDGTRQTTAYVPTNVKLTSPGNRRIEEVYGYKQVSVTVTTTGNTITTTSANSNENGTWQVNIVATGAEYNTLIALEEGDAFYQIEVSADQTTWTKGDVGGWGPSTIQIVFNDGPVGPTFDSGDTVYYRIISGGDPMTWWDKSELPGGSSNFRGAVIDYHAYTGDATIIGTIHIVDDDGEDNITHTEVSSGSSDSENDDLWYVTTEGRIRYRRLDGESSTLKIQWTAKVFYGSEYYND